MPDWAGSENPKGPKRAQKGMSWSPKGEASHSHPHLMSALQSSSALMVSVWPLQAACRREWGEAKGGRATISPEGAGPWGWPLVQAFLFLFYSEGLNLNVYTSHLVQACPAVAGGGVHRGAGADERSDGSALPLVRRLRAGLPSQAQSTRVYIVCGQFVYRIA